MSDPRLSDYAKLLVEDCVDAQLGWQVVVMGSYLGRPLLEEVVRQVARRGAYAFLHVTFGETSTTSRAWLLDERARLQRYADRFDAAEEVRIVGDGTLDGEVVQRDGAWLV